MDKILIVGHQNSNYRTLEEILLNHGLSRPLNSYTHRMTPQLITAKLLKASLEKPVKSIGHTNRERSTTVSNKHNYKVDDRSSSYVQRHPNKMWDTLVFDLLLANIDQPLWGWADDKAIELLEYLANFDEDMAFILTYDKPHGILKNISEHSNLEDFDKQLQSHLENWASYNKLMLAFYKKYPERCMLVNGEQVVHSSKDYVESVAKKIAWQIDALQTYDKTQIDKNLNENLSNPQIIDFFIEKVIAQHDSISEVFDNLQQSADISLTVQHQTRDALTMLKTAVLQQQDLSATKQQNQQIKKEVNKTQKQLTTYTKENSAIFKQLQQVQEELEQYYLANKRSQEDLEAINQAITQAKQETEYEKQRVDQLKQDKQNSETKILKQQENAKQTQIKLAKLENELKEAQQRITVSKDTQQENTLLLTQLHQVQEELEKYYLENQRLKETKIKDHQSIEPVYYGAADKIKQDLPYRLGSTMIKYSKSPRSLATLPFALASEYKRFHNDASYRQLPDLVKYQDTYEAEKVKKHLSYRLGKALTDGMQSPKEFIKLPVTLSKELVEFKKR